MIVQVVQLGMRTAGHPSGPQLLHVSVLIYRGQAHPKCTVADYLLGMIPGRASFFLSDKYGLCSPAQLKHLIIAEI